MGHLLGLVGVRDEAQHDGIEPVGVAAHELLEGEPVAGLGALDELSLVALRQRRAHARAALGMMRRHHP